jgi:hypothetical protein
MSNAPAVGPEGRSYEKRVVHESRVNDGRDRAAAVVNARPAELLEQIVLGPTRVHVSVHDGRVGPGVIGVDGKVAVDGRTGRLEEAVQRRVRPARVEGPDLRWPELIVGPEPTGHLRRADFLPVAERADADPDLALGLDLVGRPQHGP